MEFIYTPREWFDYWDQAKEIAEQTKCKSVDEVAREHFNGIIIEERDGFTWIKTPKYHAGKKQLSDCWFNISKKSADHFHEALKHPINQVAFSFRLPEVQGIKHLDLENIDFSLITNPFILQYLLVTPSTILPCLYPRIEEYPEATLFLTSEHYIHPGKEMAEDSINYLLNKEIN